MSERNLELAKAWLKKAQNDVTSAREILLMQDGPTDTPCFHAQQGVEKSLKSLLTKHGVSFPRTHDLVRLLDIATPYAVELRGYREDFAKISNYAVEIRYITDFFEPAREDAEAALEIAEKIILIIEKYIR